MYPGVWKHASAPLSYFIFIGEMQESQIRCSRELGSNVLGLRNIAVSTHTSPHDYGRSWGEAKTFTILPLE